MTQPNKQDPIEEAVNDEKNTAAEALRIAKELEEKLTNKPDETQQEIDPAELLNSPDFAKKAQELTGMTDAQVDFVVKTAKAAAASGNEKSAIADIKLRHPDFAKFEKSIKDELRNYPPDKRGNVAIIEKLYYVEKGKDAEKNGGRSSERNQIRGNGPTGHGLDNDNHNNSGSDALNADELYVARKMGITPADYAKSKGTRLIHELK